LPAFNGTARWNLGALAPGELRTFSVWGRVYGDDGQMVVNNARLYSASSFVALASAGVSIKKPIEPRISLRAVYPNPAPSDKPGLMARLMARAEAAQKAANSSGSGKGKSGKKKY
jgi:hypothetical protein